MPSSSPPSSSPPGPTMEEELEMGIPPGVKSFSLLFEDGLAEIYVFHCNDESKMIRRRLDYEFDNVALRNPEYERDAPNQDKSHQIALIYIEGFFNDDSDFVYYVKGRKNISRFMMGTWSGGAVYDGPCFATPCPANSVDEIMIKATDDATELQKLDRVSKTELGGIRWKYLYETGKAVWGKLDYDWEKMKRIRKQVQMEVLMQDAAGKPDDEEWEDIDEAIGPEDFEVEDDNGGESSSSQAQRQRKVEFAVPALPDTLASEETAVPVSPGKRKYTMDYGETEEEIGEEAWAERIREAKKGKQAATEATGALSQQYKAFRTLEMKKMAEPWDVREDTPLPEMGSGDDNLLSRPGRIVSTGDGDVDRSSSKYPSLPSPEADKENRKYLEESGEDK